MLSERLASQVTNRRVPTASSEIVGRQQARVRSSAPPKNATITIPAYSNLRQTGISRLVASAGEPSGDVSLIGPLRHFGGQPWDHCQPFGPSILRAKKLQARRPTADCRAAPACPGADPHLDFAPWFGQNAGFLRIFAGFEPRKSGQPRYPAAARFPCLRSTLTRSRSLKTNTPTSTSWRTSVARNWAAFTVRTGVIKTVNMSGRALVEFDGHNNIGWYDIRARLSEDRRQTSREAGRSQGSEACARCEGGCSGSQACGRCQTCAGDWRETIDGRYLGRRACQGGRRDAGCRTGKGRGCAGRKTPPAPN